MSLRDKMLAVIDDVNGSVAEREELVEMIAIALLTRKNLFVLGEPGQAKSYAINLFRRHITGARQFERLLSKQSDEEQLFGRVDLSSLIPGSIPDSALEGDEVYRSLRSDLKCTVDGLGQREDTPEIFAMLNRAAERLESYRKAVALLHQNEPVVQTAGKIPAAELVFLDECFKCNDGVLNSLLTALNERKYTNEGHTYPIPTISFFAASNEIPNFSDPQEKILEALYDRLELKVVTANIEDRDTRLAVLKNKQSGAFGQVNATITLDELLEMQREVAAIPVPDAANELADDILCELRKSMAVSDRKYLGYYPIAQAKAWLSGHDKVESYRSAGAEKLPLAFAHGPREGRKCSEPPVHQSNAGKGQRHPRDGAELAGGVCAGLRRRQPRRPFPQGVHQAARGADTALSKAVRASRCRTVGQ